MTRQPHVPPADWTPREAGREQLGNVQPDALVARLLELRGVDTDGSDAFFAPDLDHLHDPHDMLGMEQAVDRLVEAQREGQRIRGLRCGRCHLCGPHPGIPVQQWI